MFSALVLTLAFFSSQGEPPSMLAKPSNDIQLEDLARYRNEQMQSRPWDVQAPYEAAAEVLHQNELFYRAWQKVSEPELVDRVEDESSGYQQERKELLQRLRQQQDALKPFLKEPKASIVVVVQCMDHRLYSNFMCGGTNYRCCDAGSVLDDAENSSLVGALKLAQESQKGVVVLFTVHTNCGKETVLEHMKGRKAIGLEGIQHRHMDFSVASQYVNSWLAQHCPDSYNMFLTGEAVALFGEIQTDSLLLRKVRLIPVRTSAH
jgi:hypothetical protein